MDEIVDEKLSCEGILNYKNIGKLFKGNAKDILTTIDYEVTR